MVIKEQLTTAEQFEIFIARPENADRLFELINGEIVEKVPTQKHGMIVLKLGARLLDWVEQHKVGRVAVDVRHRIPEDNHNARLPDVSYYADDSKPIVERGPTPYMPDLAVEVQSPDDSLPVMRAKARYYLENGCGVVWLVIPEKQLVEVYQTDGFEDILTNADTLDGGDLLPGFTLAVKDIFPNK